MNVSKPRTASKNTPLSRWGDALGAGFQVVPDVLIRYQKTLGISAVDMLVLLNLLLHWWYTDRSRPCPKTGTIAERMGIDARTVQRSFKNLEERDLIKRVSDNDTGNKKGRKTRYFDLSGLVLKLQELARKDAYFKPLSGGLERPFSDFTDAS